MRDDLRMMAPNAVAAREGAMKQYRNCWYIMFIAASIIRRKKGSGSQWKQRRFSNVTIALWDA